MKSYYGQINTWNIAKGTFTLVTSIGKVEMSVEKASSLEDVFFEAMKNRKWVKLVFEYDNGDRDNGSNED